MNQLLTAAAAAALGCGLMLTPAAHADPAEYCTGLERYPAAYDRCMAAYSNPGNPNGIPDWNPCYPTGLNAHGQECDPQLPGG
jgi:hypothetical protein